MTYRSSTHSTTGVSPSSLFLKREIHARFDLLRPNRESHVRDKQEQQKVDHDRHARVHQFAVNDPVMVKNFRTGPDWLPATIVACLGPLSYLVQTTDNQVWRRHVDHVKSRVVRAETGNRSDPNQGDSWDIDVFGTAQPSDETTEPNMPAETTEEQSGSVSTDDVTDSTMNPEPSTVDSSVETRSYPQREHHAPNYYRPGV